MAMQGWAYKLVHMGNPLQADVEKRANALGRVGWELVGTDAGVWIFKRPTEASAESTEALLEQMVPLATAADPSEGAVVLPVHSTQEHRRRGPPGSHTD
jgi:hypothetical protein